MLAINPYYAVTFMLGHGKIALVTLGLVFLAVTGGEALYADLGHFGRKPIQTAWLVLVLPALLINYFGQGALVLANPEAIENPFYLLVPDFLLLPMVVLATAATVIASQAVITGAYSLIHQAIQLGFLPRLAIVHTSEAQYGQIYIPRVNAILLIGVVLLVLLFRSSSELASAYGIAVTTTMVVDGLLGFIVIWRLWNWKWWQAALLIIPFVLIDSTFLAANLLKLFEGAWVPVLFAGVMVLLIATWRRGTQILVDKTRKTEVPLEVLLRSLEKKPPHVVPGTAVFLTSDPSSAPTALMHNLKHNKILHEHNVILTIITTDTPRVPEDERVTMTPVSPHFSKVALKFGYMESPNVPKALAIARKQGWTFDIMSTSFFLSRRALKPVAAFGHAVLAGPPVHRAGAGRQRRHRLFPDPDRPRGRSRHAGHRLRSRQSCGWLSFASAQPLSCSREAGVPESSISFSPFHVSSKNEGAERRRAPGTPARRAGGRARPGSPHGAPLRRFSTPEPPA